MANMIDILDYEVAPNPQEAVHLRPREDMFAFSKLEILVDNLFPLISQIAVV